VVVFHFHFTLTGGGGSSVFLRRLLLGAVGLSAFGISTGVNLGRIFGGFFTILG